MRNFLNMPKELQGESLRAIPNKEADKAALRKFAKLAQCLVFKSPEINTLKEFPHSTPAAATHTLSKPVLLTSGRGEIKSHRCGLPRKQTYAEDSESLYLNNICFRRRSWRRCHVFLRPPVALLCILQQAPLDLHEQRHTWIQPPATGES